MEQSMNNRGFGFAAPFDPLLGALIGARPDSNESTRHCRYSRSHKALARLKMLQIDNARRQVSQIEAMISDLERMATALESDIQAEQDRTGIHNPAHFAYPTYAKAATARRDNLNRSITGFRKQLVAAHRLLAEASEQNQDTARVVA
jgi:hypothetical protein